MNYPNLPVILAAVLFISGCDQLQSSLQGTESDDMAEGSTPTAATPAPSGKILATVNGSAITEDVLSVYAKTRQAQAGDNSKIAALEELVSLELMRQEGDKSGVVSRPIVAALLNHQRRTAIAGAAISDYIQANQPSDEEVQKLYDEKIGKAGREFNARHILVATSEEAVEIINSLDGDADFSELAMEKSTGPSGKSGGKLGWFAPGQMVKPFSDAAATLEKGNYTKEPVETQFGWHVIILDDVRDVTPPPFDDVKDRLKTLIANQSLQTHIQEMKNTADIQITME